MGKGCFEGTAPGETKNAKHVHTGPWFAERKNDQEFDFLINYHN